MANWDHLWLSVPMATGLGISGQAFVGADIGGFEGDTNAELFLRWMQYGTLTPFCRNHSAIGWIDQYAWSFGEVVEDLVRDAIRLRYRLLPYIYTTFVTASETGAPVQRPLVFDHQHDHTARDLDDQYMFGPDLLVAPVLKPGVTARHVYLPEGTWYDWHTDEVVVGPRLRDGRRLVGTHPSLRSRWRCDPDVDRGSTVDCGIPTDDDRATPVRPGRRWHVPARCCRKTMAPPSPPTMVPASERRSK